VGYYNSGYIYDYSLKPPYPNLRYMQIHIYLPKGNINNIISRFLSMDWFEDYLFPQINSISTLAYLFHLGLNSVGRMGFI
jgi:hypothetical protein